MPGGSARSARAAEAAPDAAPENEDPSTPSDPKKTPRKRTPKARLQVRIEAPASASPGPAPPVPPAGAASVDPGELRDLMAKMTRQLESIAQAVAGPPSNNQHEAPIQVDDDEEEATTQRSAPTPASDTRVGRSIPQSDLLSHIPRHTMAWWDNHPGGTPIAFKELPGQLRGALAKNERDRLEAQQAFTALTLTGSITDALVALLNDGDMHYAQLALELILTHLSPMLARRVDALQQDGPLRSVFTCAQDPHSQYFIADPDTSYSLLQKVSSARVQAFMAAASRKGGREDAEANRANNRRGGQQRQGAAGSPPQRARPRGPSTATSTNAGGSSRRAGSSRDRGTPRERGGSRDGAPSRSQPADTPARGADRN